MLGLGNSPHVQPHRTREGLDHALEGVSKSKTAKDDKSKTTQDDKSRTTQITTRNKLRQEKT